MKRTLLFGLCLSLLLAVAFGQLNFVSTQFHPATEREYFEGSLLPDFVKLTNVKVQFLRRAPRRDGTDGFGWFTQRYLRRHLF